MASYVTALVDVEAQSLVDKYAAARALVRIARGSLTLDELTKIVRRLYIMDAMEECNYNSVRCARLLGVHRNTLALNLQTLDIQGEVKRLKKIRNGKGKC